MCQTHLTDAKSVLPLRLMALRMCLFLCVCAFVSMCLCSVSVCVSVCIGRQDEHPFCYRCCPFISRSGSSAWIFFPWLIISAVQWASIPPECRVKLNHYSSMGVSADIVPLLSSIFITFPSEIRKQPPSPDVVWWSRLILERLTWDWWTPVERLVPLLDSYWSVRVFFGRVQRAGSWFRTPAGQHYSVGRRKRHFEVTLDPTPATINYMRRCLTPTPSPHLPWWFNCQFSVS